MLGLGPIISVRVDVMVGVSVSQLLVSGWFVVS